MGRLLPNLFDAAVYHLVFLKIVRIKMLLLYYTIPINNYILYKVIFIKKLIKDQILQKNLNFTDIVPQNYMYIIPATQFYSIIANNTIIYCYV